MKKQTTDEENMDMDIVPDIVSFNLGWDTCQKQQKSGYNQAISDVEKIIDEMIHRQWGIRPWTIEELKQEIARLKGEKTHNGN